MRAMTLTLPFFGLAGLSPIALILGWQARAASRAALSRLDARLLDDAGISPEAAAREAAKPLWLA